MKQLRVYEFLELLFLEIFRSRNLQIQSLLMISDFNKKAYSLNSDYEACQNSRA